MIPELLVSRNTVAEEAFTISSVSDLFSRVMPGIAQAFATFKERFNTDQPAIALTSKQREFITRIKQIGYADQMDLTIYTPEGFDGKKATYLDYGMALSGAVERAVTVQDTMNKYSLYLAALLTNKDQKMSTQNNQRIYKDLERTRAKINLDLGSFFKPGSTSSSAPLGDVIKRTADWETVFSICDKISQSIESVPRTVVMRKMNETADMLDRLLKMIERKEVEGISPETVQEISNGAFQVASELEFYAVTHYRVLAFVEAVNRSVLSLNDRLQ